MTTGRTLSFFQFLIVAMEDVEYARVAMPDVPHLGRMYEHHDPDEGALPPDVRLPGIRRPRDGDEHEGPLAKNRRTDAANVIELPGDRKRQRSIDC